MRAIQLICVAAAIILLLPSASCSRKERGSAKPVVAVSFDSQKEIVERIAGDDYRVVALLPPGSDPEMFDPDMRVMKALEQAEIYLTTSTLGFEQQVGERIRANYPTLKVTDLTSGIDILMHTHDLASAATSYMQACAASSESEGSYFPHQKDDDGGHEGHGHGESHQVGVSPFGTESGPFGRIHAPLRRS